MLEGDRETSSATMASPGRRRTTESFPVRGYSSARQMPPKKSVQLSGVVVAETELCSIDAERGILMYRGYDIADLAEHASYEEVAYLLLAGELPNGEQLSTFEEELSQRELPRA